MGSFFDLCESQLAQVGESDEFESRAREFLLGRLNSAASQRIPKGPARDVATAGLSDARAGLEQAKADVQAGLAEIESNRRPRLDNASDDVTADAVFTAGVAIGLAGVALVAGGALAPRLLVPALLPGCTSPAASLWRPGSRLQQSR